MEWWLSFWETYNSLILSVGVNTLLALSLYITLSCGLLSLANAAFMAIGAYTAAILTMSYEMPFAISLLASCVTPSMMALLIGVPVLRLSGVYLAMATLGFGEVVRVILLNMPITGGPLGLNGVPNLTEWYHVLLILFLIFFVIYRLTTSKIGRAFEAIKEDEIAASLMGIAVTKYKLLAFTISAFIAGLAGGLSVHYTSTISPGEFAFARAVDLLTMTILGGTTSLVGPFIGSSILTLLPEVLRFLNEYRLAVNGLILVLVVLYLPNGIYAPKRTRQK